MFFKSFHPQRRPAVSLSTLLALSMLPLSCFDDTPVGPETLPVEEPSWKCVIEGAAPHYTHTIGCKEDFTAMASTPMNATISGATSVKTVIDRQDTSNTNPLYFQNCKEYLIHHEFTSFNLSGNGRPVVRPLGEFNTTEYTDPNRRFVLGEVTYYEGPKIWAYQMASNDNATAEMITMAIEKITDSCFFGESLYFHPVSVTQENEAKKLSNSIKIKLTDEIYAGVDYQPLNCATSMGKLVFVKAEDLATAYVGFRDITVLDVVPNDISVTSGIITEAFQTPLAHINVLSMNRKTPNMALRGAWNNSELRALEGKWVKLVVDLMEYTIVEVTTVEADAWWAEHGPTPLGIANMDTATKDLRDVKDILDIANLGLGPALKKAIPAYGGKTSHFSAFPHMDSSKVPYPAEAFGIPVFYYWQFMEQNGFNAQVAQMLDDPVFKSNPAVRDSTLKALRDSMMVKPLDPAFEVMLFAKLNTKFNAGTQVRFRSSTNAEDLEGFTGAGLYISEGGNMDRPNSLRNAIRTVWGSIWFFRAFEERDYRQIDQKSVGMAILVHRSFPAEEATGVAITSNIYDKTGMDPGFYVNVQYGDGSVVLPGQNVYSDEFIYKIDLTGQPIIYLSHSNQLPEGQETVLTKAQVHKLGTALKEIHDYFQPLYGSDFSKPFSMDTEFKFDQPLDDPTGESVLSMKQCRPYFSQ